MQKVICQMANSSDNGNLGKLLPNCISSGQCNSGCLKLVPDAAKPVSNTLLLRLLL